MSIEPSLRVAAQAGSGTHPSQVVVARTVEEVEGLREAWETSRVSDIDSDIDYFLTVVRHAPGVLRPHVVLIRRPGQPALMAVARLERLHVPVSLGYRTVMRAAAGDRGDLRRPGRHRGGCRRETAHR